MPEMTPDEMKALIDKARRIDGMWSKEQIAEHANRLADALAALSAHPAEETSRERRPAPQAPVPKPVLVEAGCGIEWRSPMHGDVWCMEHRNGTHYWRGPHKSYAWVMDEHLHSGRRG